MLTVASLLSTVLVAAYFCSGGAAADPPNDDVTAPAITDVKAGNITSTSATITWTTDEPATSQVEYGLDHGYGSFTTPDLTLLTSHTVLLDGLTVGTTYHYRVISADAAGNAAQSGDHSFTVSDRVAPEISGVAAINVTASGATIIWTTNEPASSQVEYGIRVPYGSRTSLDATLVTSHSVQLTGLKARTTYHYSVRSKDASNNETRSGDYTFTTLATADNEAPVISKVDTNVTATSATITWITNEAATSQVVYGLPIIYGSTTSLDAALVFNHSVALTGLSPKTTYHYRVISADAAGNRAQSRDYTFVTGDSDAPVITDVGYENLTAMSVILTWTTDEPATSEVEYGESASYGSTTSHDLTLVTDHRVSLTGLRPQTTYHYMVKSRDASGENWGYSTDQTFTTPDVSPPAISGVYSTDIATTSATIVWTTSENATSQVVYGTSAKYGSTTSHDTTMVRSHSVTLANLTADTTYHYKVKSKDAAGLWSESSDYTFTTADVNAPVISQVTAINITATGASITWTTDDAAESQVEYGTKETYGSITTLDANRVTSHRVDLAGLSPGTTYHYKAKSRDASGLWAWSGDYTFTTGGDPAGAGGTTPTGGNGPGSAITGEASSFRMPMWAWAAIGVVVALALGVMIVRDV